MYAFKHPQSGEVNYRPCSQGGSSISSEISNKSEISCKICEYCSRVCPIRRKKRRERLGDIFRDAATQRGSSYEKKSKNRPDIHSLNVYQCTKWQDRPCSQVCTKKIRKCFPEQTTPCPPKSATNPFESTLMGSKTPRFSANDESSLIATASRYKSNPNEICGCSTLYGKHFNSVEMNSRSYNYWQNQPYNVYCANQMYKFGKTDSVVSSYPHISKSCLVTPLSGSSTSLHPEHLASFNESSYKQPLNLFKICSALGVTHKLSFCGNGNVQEVPFCPKLIGSTDPLSQPLNAIRITEKNDVETPKKMPVLQDKPRTFASEIKFNLDKNSYTTATQTKRNNRNNILNKEKAKGQFHKKKRVCKKMRL